VRLRNPVEKKRKLEDGGFEYFQGRMAGKKGFKRGMTTSALNCKKKRSSGKLETQWLIVGRTELAWGEGVCGSLVRKENANRGRKFTIFEGAGCKNLGKSTMTEEGPCGRNRAQFRGEGRGGQSG